MFQDRSFYLSIFNIENYKLRFINFGDITDEIAKKSQRKIF